MKFNPEKKLTTFSQRTLEAFMRTFFSLLKSKPFEKITVNEICEIAKYTRATFYNYFEDIYDFLEYCWMTIEKDILPFDITETPYGQRVVLIFDKLYSFMEEYSPSISMIIRQNPLNDSFTNLIKTYMIRTTYKIVEESAKTVSFNIPFEMAAEHYCNTIIMVLKWCFFESRTLSLEEGEHCIQYLLSPLEDIKK